MKAYTIDFLEDTPVKITNKCSSMLKDMNGKINYIFFCHGVISFMGGVDGSFMDWDKV